MHGKLIGKWFTVILLSYAITSLSLFAAEPPEIAAKSYLLIDYNSQVVLASKNADKRIELASITKLMTAYVLYKELEKGNVSKNDVVLISEKAWRMKGSRMFVEANKKVPFERLMNGLIIQSGNDAAVALAEHAYGTEASFVSRMNSEAKRLGMTNTHFTNATGWPDKNHYSTANDIARLTRTVISEYPKHYKEYKIKEYSYNGIKQYNRNKLLWLDPTVDGVKTGHTESAGYCLVSSAKRNGMRLISVVIGTDTVKERSFASQQLLEYGYQFFETNKVYAANHALEEIRIWKGEKEKVAVGFIDDFYVTVAKGSYSSLKGNISYESGIDAPIYRGDKLGKVVLKNAQDKVVLEAPLEALETVTGGGLWRKVTDGVQKVFH
ncbi:MAG: D-alanyl-D-alanine carboxypeptidase (EC [uncultured Thiotrichaceae bacterium]|uniref:serine-type D-Ala-D-Ala carboxypeptidase n=1 Tax=uncultured Thiotrichaceae bacterium TaxID=298394 RepID=A0A6S6SUA8_9GAMM|nr:MAG: D-alanyl-D-alanine carboxypeptidase (EC [uncultured Thiotrichaceae bacterium]